MSKRETDVLRWLSGGMAVGSIMAVNRLVMLVLTVLLARTLGPAQFGVYAYTISMVTFLALLCELGFPIVVEREVASVGSANGWRRVRGLIQMAVWVQLALGGVVVALNLVLNVALIPVYGMLGAATATLLSALVWHGMLSWGIRKHIGIRPTVFEA